MIKLQEKLKHREATRNYLEVKGVDVYHINLEIGLIKSEITQLKNIITGLRKKIDDDDFIQKTLGGLRQLFDHNYLRKINHHVYIYYNKNNQ